MSNSPRLSVPYLSVGQSQKEVTHNEGINRLDALVQTAVESMALTAPPSGTEGILYVVGNGATGAWVGKDKYLAQYIGGAWAFFLPFEGMRIWNKATFEAVVYKAGSWFNEVTAAGKIGFFGTAPIVKTTVALNNADGAIGALTFSATPTQAECQALRDQCELLADDVRTLKAALSGYGLL